MITIKKFILTMVVILAAFVSCCFAQKEGSSCTMKTGEQGTCTILPQCKFIHEALTRRTFPIKNLVICSFANNKAVICCTDNVNASAPDSSVKIFHQGRGHTASASNLPETLANVDVKEVVPIGNVNINDKDKYTYVARIWNNFVEESAEKNQKRNRKQTYAKRSQKSASPYKPPVMKAWMPSSNAIWPSSIRTTSTANQRPKQTRTKKGRRQKPTSGSNVANATAMNNFIGNISIKASGSIKPSTTSSSSPKSTSSRRVEIPNRNKDSVNLMPAGQPGRKADKECEKYQKGFLKLPTPVQFQILSGETAFEGEFPHMAALGHLVEKGGKTVVKLICGGSLISNRYVMTAAHCVRRRENMPTVIRLGGLYLDEVTEESIDVGVEKVILHPAYQNKLQYHDIALIRLNVTLPLDTTYIYPACLNTDRRDDMQPNLKLVAAGWGWTDLSMRTHSPRLLKANLLTVRLDECKKKHIGYENNRRLPDGVNISQICTLEPDLKHDTCPGDSGGPLQSILKSKLSKVYGITSFGIFCGTAIPSVYARVSFYLDWLESVVWPSTS